MDVLVIESNARSATEVARDLRDAGHRVHTCFEAGMETFPCRALFSGGHCPLDAPGVDVALLVRAHPWPSPTARERGAICALRAGVPLVVAGQLVIDPFKRWAAERVDGTDGIVDACERAACVATAAPDRLFRAEACE